MGSIRESQWGTCTHVSAGRGSRCACMLHWDPSNCDSRKILRDPGWKNRCSDGKVSVEREARHPYHIFSYTLSQQIKVWLKISVRNTENNVRNKFLLNFMLPQWCMLCDHCVPVVFIPTAFLSNLLHSCMGVLIKGMDMRKLEHYNKVTAFLFCGAMLALYMYAYVCFPCHSPAILKAENI